MIIAASVSESKYGIRRIFFQKMGYLTLQVLIQQFKKAINSSGGLMTT